MQVPPRVKILLLVLAVAMVALSVYAVNNAVTGSDSTSQSLPDYVDRLIPASGDEALSQSTVGIDLAEGYDAYLVVEGVAIRNDATESDADGLTRAPSLGTIEYDPAPGRRVEKLSSPEACVDAWVWKSLDGPAGAKQINWCFKVS